MIPTLSSEGDWRSWTWHFESKVWQLGLWGMVFKGEEPLEEPPQPDPSEILEMRRQDMAGQLEEGGDGIFQCSQPPPRTSGPNPAYQGSTTAQPRQRGEIQSRARQERYDAIRRIFAEDYGSLYEALMLEYSAELARYHNQVDGIRVLKGFVRETVSSDYVYICCAPEAGVSEWYRDLKLFCG